MPTLPRPFAKPFVAVPDFEQTKIDLLPASYGQRTTSSMLAFLYVSVVDPAPAQALVSGFPAPLQGHSARADIHWCTG